MHVLGFGAVSIQGFVRADITDCCVPCVCMSCSQVSAQYNSIQVVLRGSASHTFLILLNWLQGIRYDPDGLHINAWVPEMADLPVEFVHQPWLLPSSGDDKCKHPRDAGKPNGYPLPIIDPYGQVGKPPPARGGSLPTGR
jgi:hypothetical protein